MTLISTARNAQTPRIETPRARSTASSLRRPLSPMSKPTRLRRTESAIVGIVKGRNQRRRNRAWFARSRTAPSSRVTPAPPR